MESALEKIEERAVSFLKKHKVSLKTGFLAEKPLLGIPRNFDDSERRKYCSKVDELAYSLTRLISEGCVCLAVDKLPLPKPEYFLGLTWQAAHRFMLAVAMPTQAYFRELLAYKNVQELMEDNSPKHLPPQLAIPMWELHKITGINPSMSYGLYALWNYYKIDSEKPLGLDNIDMIHSFTGTRDEKWFVWIHQIVEMSFAPAIKALVSADLLARKSLSLGQTAPDAEDMQRFLGDAADASMATVNVLERMREHCDQKTYFDKVRMFYSFPRNAVFEGVDDPDIKGKSLEIFGETGGQTPYQHFRLSALGIKHKKSAYFVKMRQHMSRPFRELVEYMDSSKIREFVLVSKSNRKLVRRYNMLVQSVLDWRAEHIQLVDEYIKTYGEVYGTGKPPLTWLQELYDETKTYLIE